MAPAHRAREVNSGAIVSARQAALQLHRAREGNSEEDPIGIMRCNRMLRQMHASSTGRKRGRCINWGLGKPLFSGSGCAPRRLRVHDM